MPTNSLAATGALLEIRRFMKPPAETLKESLTQSRRELTDFMRINTPAAAARELEKSGWSWE